MLAPKLDPTLAVWGNCFVCRATMRIMLIEPHPKSDTLQVRTFECIGCGRTRTCTIDPN
jgi:hypothetical protein